MKLWIARDKDTSLWLYENKPKRENREFYGTDNVHISGLSHCFPEITWENSPQEVEIKLIKDENRTH